jgi:hypothetical protein
MEPTRCRIEPYHESEFSSRGPLSLDDWQRLLAAPAIFNAGLYDEHRRHLGVLRRQDRDLGGLPHERWQGMLASGSRVPYPHLPPAPGATLLDLSRPDDRRREADYPNAVQSMMLFDREGRVRVRRTDRLAPRTLVAIDTEGRLVVLVTEGVYTLFESASLLREANLGLVAAMALDGGNESGLVVVADSVRYRSRDAAEPGTDPGLGPPLPAVVAVWPAQANG